MFTHTGPRRSDFFAESSFAKQIALIEKNLQKKYLYVGNLNSLRTIADVRDAVDAYFKILSKLIIPKENKTLYNPGTSWPLEEKKISLFKLLFSFLIGN